MAVFTVFNRWQWYIDCFDVFVTFFIFYLLLLLFYDNTLQTNNKNHILLLLHFLNQTEQKKI